MSILCCRRSNPTLSPAQKPVILPSKILRCISVPRSQTSRQNIEAFYNEGRELLQARREENERSSLQNVAQTTHGTLTSDPLDRDDPHSRAVELCGAIGLTTKARGDSKLAGDGTRQAQFSSSDTKTAPARGSRWPSKSYSAGELCAPRISAVPTYSKIHKTLVSGKSMPALTGPLEPGMARNDSRSILPGDTSYIALPASFPATNTILPVQRPPSKTPTISGVNLVSIPSTPGLNPYLMPSIATTIASINDSSGEAVTVAGNSVATSERSLRRSSAHGDAKDQQGSYDYTSRADISLDGTTTDNGEAMTTAEVNSRGMKKQRDTSNDSRSSGDCFTPNELFSKIPTWVRPSTSTFMSFPSSPDHNRNDGLGSPPSTGSATPDRTKSISSKFYSPLEMASTGNTGASTPDFVCPPTPGYQFRPSIDNTSSFYPSRETSRCVSLSGSMGNTPEPLEASALSANAAFRMLNRTPRPLDRMNTTGSPERLSFKFPWVSRSDNKSPEPITNEGAFTRSSSLAHLKKTQKRDRELQRVPRVNPRNPKPSKLQGTFDQKYDKGYENLRLQDYNSPILALPGSPRHDPPGRDSQYFDNFEGREFLDNGTSPTTITDESTGYASWIRSTTRISSLPVSGENPNHPRNRNSPHAWKSGTSKGNTLSNYGKAEKKFFLKNSISLGERMWERSSILGKDQGKLRRTTIANVLPGPMADLEAHVEAEERNELLRNKRSRAMIRSRSMTLRRTFTNSIAKLRGKVSFSGSSKGTIVTSPEGKHLNRDRFYQRRNGEGPVEKIPEVLNEKQELGVSESDVSSILFRPTLPREMLEHESALELNNDISPGNGNIIVQHSGLDLESPLGLDTASDRVSNDPSLAGQSFGPVAEGPGSRRWSTIYDDCVAFPFGEGDTQESNKDSGSDSDLDTPQGRPFEARGEKVKQVWRDARESLETTV